ncbi:MAG: cytidylate kinase-like family protein [Thermoflexales bacterium]|nr:cytidylate kinase-like family protein [Thermoflexales bacterium]
MTVLTISREYGSEGRHIAQSVAQTLGYHFVDKRTIESVLIQYGFAEFYKEYEATPSVWDRLDPHKTELIGMLNRVIRGLARHGHVVLLGRGSFAVLRDLADVLNVRIKAPLPLRVKRVMQQRGIFSPEQAQAVVIDSDRVRAAFIETYYGVHWDSAELFDLIIDTGKVAPDLAADWISAAMKARPETRASLEPTTRTLEQDTVLAVAIATALKCEAEH